MDVELLFLGTGTSAGIPMIGCHCPVCTSADPHDWRNRASVVISYGDTRVLIDTTPELRLQCVAHDVHRIDAIVFTHAHADHIMGLDDVRRFNAVSDGPLDAWSDDVTQASLDRCFGYCFAPPDPQAGVFRPHLRRRAITGAFQIGPLTWHPIPLLHGRAPILGFRVGNLAYCTDVSEIPAGSWPLLEGLDLLVLDALRHRPHPTHFNLDQAVAAVKRLGPRRALFTHIAHDLAHEETNQSLPDGIDLAFDGQRVLVSAG